MKVVGYQQPTVLALVSGRNLWLN